MGNCSQKCSASFHPPPRIRILTDSGRIMELQGPKLARDVLDDFPGYGIFRRGQAALPMFDDEHLHGGHLYFLLPFGVSASTAVAAAAADEAALTVKASGSNGGGGVWRVKLAISAEELKGMLSEGANAEALIGRVRVAAGEGKEGRMWRQAVKNYWLFGHRSSPVPAGSVLVG